MLPGVTIYLKVWLCFILTQRNSFDGSTQALDLMACQDPGDACFSMDTCHNEFPNFDSDSRGCSCSSFGVKCCLNPPYLQEKTNVQCVSVPYSGLTVSMVTRCGDNWSEQSRVKELCESKRMFLGDPIEIVPVTHAPTGVTYKNFFCAQCNNDHSNVVFWNININRNRFSYPAESDGRLLTLEYENNTRSWLYRLHSETAGDAADIADYVYLVISVPDGFSEKIQRCSLDSRRQRFKCRTYMAKVTVTVKHSKRISDQVYFHEANCSICQNVSDFTTDILSPWYPLTTDIIRTTTLVLGAEIDPNARIFPLESDLGSVTELLGKVTFDTSCIEKQEVYVESFGGCRKILKRPKRVRSK